MNIEQISSYIRGQGIQDPEFAYTMRYYTGAMKLAIDDEEAVFVFDDGTLVEDSAPRTDDECEIIVRGTRTHWDEMLEEYPRPFFQCIQTTAIKHGMSLSNTDSFYAYLPALNRLTALLRKQSVAQKKGA